MRTEIGVIVRERFVELRARFAFDITDVGEPFGSQQSLGDILRSAADTRRFQQPHGRGFEGPLSSRRTRGRTRPAVAAPAIPLMKSRRVWISAIASLLLAFTPSARA